MLTLPKQTNQLFVQGVTLVAYVLISCLVLDLFWGEWGEEIIVTYRNFSGLEATMDHTAFRPFVYRRLTPELVKVGTNLAGYLGFSEIPASLQQSLEARFFWWKEAPSPELFILYVLHFLCIVGIAYTWRALLKLTGDFDPFFLNFAPVLGLLVYPLTFTAHGHIYDFPDLLLCSICLYFWLQNRFSWYYLVYALALFNKEAVLLLAAMCFAKFSSKGQRFECFKHCCFHALIFLAIEIPINVAYMDNEKVSLLSYTIPHFAYLLSLKAYVMLRLSYAAGLPIPSGMNLLILAFLTLALTLSWKTSHKELRRTFLFTFPGLAIMFVLFGAFDEIRVFVPVFPMCFLLGMHSLYHAHEKSAVIGQQD